MTLDLAKLRAETLALMETAKRDDCLDRMVPSDLRIAYGTTLRLMDEIERLRAENETAVRRGAEWMRDRIAELARQTAANIIAESAGGPRHRRGYEAGRAAAFEIMARTILAVPLPANVVALPEGGPDAQ